MRRKKYRSVTKYNKNKDYVIILMVITFIVGLLIITLGINIINRAIPIYSYTIEKSDDYKVLLEPNSFYESEILPAGRILCF